jgi:hypothetical protein
MTITLDLQPEIEQGLLAQAQARGVSLTDYVQEIVSREAHVSKAAAPARTGQELVDICARVRGLADDLDITRNPSPGRPVDLS